MPSQTNTRCRQSSPISVNPAIAVTSCNWPNACKQAKFLKPFFGLMKVEVRCAKFISSSARKSCIFSSLISVGVIVRTLREKHLRHLYGFLPLLRDNFSKCSGPPVMRCLELEATRVFCLSKNSNTLCAAIN